jgi:hypothetical protein
MRKISKFFFASKRKKSVFSLVSLRSEKLEIRSETKTNEAKTQSETKWEQKNCENKSQKGQNLIVLKLRMPPPQLSLHRRAALATNSNGT